MATTLCPWLDGCVCFRVRADKTVEVRQPTSSIPRTDSLANTHVHFLGKPSGPAILAGSDSQLIRTQITASNRRLKSVSAERHIAEMSQYRVRASLSLLYISTVVLVFYQFALIFLSISTSYKPMAYGDTGRARGKSILTSIKLIQYSKSYCNKTGHQPVQ